MVKKIPLLLAVILLLSVFSGCGKESIDESTIRNDPITNYDNETVVAVEGKKNGMLVKEKKYEYNGENVEILSVENQTDEAYTIRINGYFLDEDGNKITALSKTFEGFAAEYQDYFVFQPGVKYDSFSCELTAENFDGETLANYIIPGTKWTAELGWDLSDGTRTNNEDFDVNKAYEYERYVIVMATCTGLKYTYSGTLDVFFDRVLFDNNGDIYMIDTFCKRLSGGADLPQKFLFFTDTLWKDKNKYVLPEELQGERGAIISVTSIKEASH